MRRHSFFVDDLLQTLSLPAESQEDLIHKLTGHNLLTDKEEKCSKCTRPVDMQVSTRSQRAELASKEEWVARLSAMSKNALKSLARDMGVPKSGNKKELIARLALQQEMDENPTHRLRLLRKQLRRNSTDRKFSRFSTYRREFNAVDMANRRLNQIQLPVTKNERTNFLKGMIKMAVLNTYAVWCKQHKHVELDAFVATLATAMRQYE